MFKSLLFWSYMYDHFSLNADTNGLFLSNCLCYPVYVENLSLVSLTYAKKVIGVCFNK